MTATGNRTSAPTEQVPAASALTPEARRALEEAEARRLLLAAKSLPPAEIGGRRGLDPARYGDWETGGIASDF